MLKKIGLMMMMVTLSACTSIETMEQKTSISKQASWALLPIINNSDTPQAGLRTEAIIQSLFLNKGLTQWTLYPATMNNDTLFEPSERKTFEQARDWAKAQGVRYAIAGSVEEWQYKVGVDGEPAVGLTLRIIDLNDNTIVWSAVGAKSGLSRASLSGTAQKLLQSLLEDLTLE
ncbi:MAG: penicillin-binding protein activator LpoB [Proteobacteria bacterium]|nr:penicillin-binding protein activator LpoB [Pseudomonadota bacterium]